MYRGRREFDRENFGTFLADHPELTDDSFWGREAGRASVYGSMKGFQDLFEILREPYNIKR